ncbi:RNA chaperone ProQ [Candidatus Providencia siddallii]|uniref:RNA chaperone ProQ n=1 Tax=Candidatus Providencia siddallii TaxID=1715285 RepID=A0ABM9NNY9_9GAMM
MKNQLKLNNKEIISFLTKRFPYCFIEKGRVRPLKIGIFKDIIKCLSEEDNISKTKLRSALRSYTSSQRYLYSIKAGVKRIDLDGKDSCELEKEHIIYARKRLVNINSCVRLKQLEQKKCKYFSKKKIKKNSFNDINHNIKYKNIDNKCKECLNSIFIKPEKNTFFKKDLKTIININSLKIGQMLKIKVGSNIFDALILEITKDIFRVQLSNGLEMIVRKEHLLLK